MIFKKKLNLISSMYKKTFVLNSATKGKKVGCNRLFRIARNDPKLQIRSIDLGWIFKPVAR